MPAAAEEWDRRRIRILLVVLGLTAAALVVGLVWFVMPSIAPDRGPGTSAAVDTDSRQDRIASEPMLETGRSDLQEAVTAPVQNSAIMLPPSTTIGPAQVATGYPRTPEGAVAQLAAIDVIAFAGLSTARARDVYAAWAEEPTQAASWTLTESIARFHTSAGSTDADPEVFVSIRPVAAQVKGTDGDDWVTACVLLDVRVTFRSDIRFGYGHCSRMQWVADRWVIGAGKEPWPAPSTWPGSQRSVEAGWRPWTDTVQQ